MRRVIVILAMLAAVNVFAEVPNEITYQGKLKEYGQPVNGNRTINFKIYNTASGPGLQWESGDVSVAVSSGIFSYGLTPALDWRQKDLWIETVVSGKTLSPREKITSQAFALHSRTAEDLSKQSGSTIDFVIGGSTKARVSDTGEVSSLIGNTTYYMVPRGAIIMWSGSIASIPIGWFLCDGTNGTPDLRNRFVMGVSDSFENPGNTGGSNSITLTIAQLPAHSHIVTCSLENQDHYHTGTTNLDGDHTHNAVSGVQNGGDWSSGGSGTLKYGNTTGDAKHSHSFTTDKQSTKHTHNVSLSDTGSGGQIDSRPAFYRIAFIMKI